jgi:FMN phosphatase YigB (HAD superfamily)
MCSLPLIDNPFERPVRFDVGLGCVRLQSCVLVDDSWGNMKAAKAAGWVTVLCGRQSRDGKDAMQCADADYVIGNILELPAVLPGLFR